MTTTAPEAAMLTALVAYLQAKFDATGVNDLGQSHVVDEWPDPSEPLALAQNRVVVAVIRGGNSRGDTRLGGPNVSKVTPGPGATGTVRYEFGTIEQPITLGLWAWRKQLRDDVDLFLGELLNQPMFSTISPVANTTLALATKKLGEQLVTPADMTDVWPGITLEIGTGASLERVVVKDIRPTGFVATLRGSPRRRRDRRRGRRPSRGHGRGSSPSLPGPLQQSRQLPVRRLGADARRHRGRSRAASGRSGARFAAALAG
jgi:hypothetical protein